MPSLLSESQKSLVDDVFVDVHDTFAKEFTIFRKIPVEQTGASFNPLYGGGSNHGTSPQDYVLTGITASGRIQYVDKQKEAEVESVEFELDASEGLIRLKVDSGTMNNIQTADRIEIEDVLWKPVTDPKQIGPFQRNYYMIFLKREN